jgi:uncharacterized protein YjdB
MQDNVAHVHRVLLHVTGVSLNTSSQSLTVGQTFQLTATLSPTNATNKAVTWSSSNTAIAEVDASGLVTAKAAGAATITVTTTDGGKTATCAVTVTNTTVGVTGVSLDASSQSLTVGQTFQLTETVSPTNATNKAVTWSSSNGSVASVSSSGLVTANAAGTATITVTTADGGKTATCVITVASATNVQSITFTWTGGSSKSFFVGATSGAPFTVNWGDGNTDNSTGTGSSIIHYHTYGNSATYTVTITGVNDNCPFTHLDIREQSVTSLDVSKATTLTLLHCGGNPLTTLDVSNNTALTELTCWTNQLTVLDVSKNTALIYLNLLSM